VRRRDIHRQLHVHAGPQARRTDGVGHPLQRLLVAGQWRRPATLVGHQRRVALAPNAFAGGAVDRGRPLQRPRERVGAHGHDQHVLDVDLATGVQTAGDDVHHRQRDHRSRDAGQLGDVPIQRSSGAERGGAARRQRDRQERIRAKA
jgi:hypothetical protein